MDMITAVNADVMNNLNPTAGVVMCNVSLDGVADAAAMAALIETSRGNAENWIGVTDGDIKVDEGRKSWSPTFNDKRMPFKGDKYLDTAEPKISFNMLEYIPENVVLASGAADQSGSGAHITVTPRAEYKDADYKTNIVYATMVGHEGIYAVELLNALCVKGLSSTHGDKKVGQLAVEFMGHTADPSKKDMPIKYHFFKATA